MKKIYKIALIIVSIIVLALGVYFGIQFFSESDKNVNNQPENTTLNESPANNQFDDAEKKSTSTAQKDIGSPILLSDEGNQVFDFWIDSSTENISYISTLGKIYNAKSSKDEEISSQSVSALNFIEQSSSGNLILAAFGDPKNPQWGIFDATDQVWRPLPSSIDKATWSTNGDLVVVRESGASRTLEIVSVNNGSISKSDFGQNVIIDSFRLRSITINVVSENKLIVTEKPASFYRGRMWEIDLTNGNIINLINGELGLYTKWSDNFIFKFSIENNFFILDHKLNNAIPVFFNTLPSKCAESSKLIVCAAPQRSLDSNGNNLPENYMQKRQLTTDSLYSISKNSLETKTVFVSNEGGVPEIDVKNPRFLGEDELYFINRYNDGLYKVSL